MKRILLIVLAALWAQSAAANHLLHDVPGHVADAIRKDCKEKWHDSQFEQGRCNDDRAEVWLQKQKGVQPAKVNMMPDLLIKPPKLNGAK